MPIFTYNNWRIDEEKCAADELQAFSSINTVFQCEGELIVKDGISEVIKFSTVSKSYYIKRYTASGRKSFDVFRKSRIASESSNLLSLNEMGIAVPKIIAHGEKRKNGRFIMGALITEAVENSSNITQHLNHHSELTKNKKWLYSVIDQLAQHISMMHEKKSFIVI